jgi:hypothetical protein
MVNLSSPQHPQVSANLPARLSDAHGLVDSMGVGECRDGKSLPTDRESVGRDADRGSQSVPDLSGKATTDVVVMANGGVW